jgi:hypothetical protein
VEAGPAGPSHAIEVSRDSPFTVTSELRQASLVTISPGSWTVLAKSRGERVGDSASAFYACDLAAIPLTDSNIVTLAPPVYFATMSHQLSFATASEIPVVLYCRGTSVTLYDVKLTAIRLGSVGRQSYPPPN